VLLSNYTRATNAPLQRALAADLNHIVQAGPIYDPQRFANVKLSAATSNLLNQKIQGSNEIRINRILLLAAYPEELSKNRRIKESFMSRSAAEDLRWRGRIGAVCASFNHSMADDGFLLWSAAFIVSRPAGGGRIAQVSARNDELKAAGRLAAEIAHQLKNPLASSIMRRSRCNAASRREGTISAFKSRSSARRSSVPTAS